MQVRHIHIEHFRGIRQLSWSPEGPVVCLVGHGDSTKTTILDAIDIALVGRPFLAVADTDFYGLDTSQPIKIDVTVGNLPQELLSERLYGMHLGGWDATKRELGGDPTDDREPVLTVHFEVDASLEPIWTVIKKGSEEGKTIGSKNRDSLGVARIGEDPDRHLMWGRNSALTKSTDSLLGLREALSNAHKSARDALGQADLTKLQEAANKAKTAATRMGAIAKEDYRPSLVSWQRGFVSTPLSLHEGIVPLQSKGMGTRRLVAIGIQVTSTTEGGIILIDEIETGLEPHRLRHLLKTLKDDTTKGQAFFTTHSAITLIELVAEDIRIVRSTDGLTTVDLVSKDVQPLLRSTPEAFLAHRIVVAEGRTEVGIMRALEGHLSGRNGNRPLTHTGSIVVDGRSGSTAKSYSEQLASLGYDVSLLVDDDVDELDVGTAWATAARVSVFTWGEGLSVEERLCNDMSWEGVIEIAKLAMNLEGKEAVMAHLTSRGVNVASDPSAWPQASESTIRDAFGKAAKAKGYFKTIEKGEQLGEIVGNHIAELESTEFGKTLRKLEDWMYAGAERTTATS